GLVHPEQSYCSGILLSDSGAQLYVANEEMALYQYTNTAVEASDPVWSDAVSLVPSETTRVPQSGYPGAMAHNGKEVLVVGAPYWDRDGAVFVWDASGTDPVEIAMLTRTRLYGQEIEAKGDTLLVGMAGGVDVYSLYDKDGGISPVLRGTLSMPEDAMIWPEVLRLTSDRMLVSGYYYEKDARCIDVYDRETLEPMPDSQLCGVSDDDFANTFEVVEAEGEEIVIASMSDSTVQRLDSLEGEYSKAGAVSVWRWETETLTYKSCGTVESEVPLTNAQFGRDITYDSVSQVLAVGKVGLDHGCDNSSERYGAVELLGCSVSDLLTGSCTYLGSIVPVGTGSINHGSIGRYDDYIR
ncbi:hypothetical protein KIPB_010342, partial [Kipferlia bialata]